MFKSERNQLCIFKSYINNMYKFIAFKIIPSMENKTKQLQFSNHYFKYVLCSYALNVAVHLTKCYTLVKYSGRYFLNY